MTKIFSLILLAGMTMILLGCGLSDGVQEPQEVETAPVEFETPAGTVAPHVETDTRTPSVATETPMDTEAPPVETKTPAVSEAPPVETKTPAVSEAPPVETKTPSVPEASPRAVPVPYYGPSSLEERALEAPVIARVRLDSLSSTTESGNTYEGTKYLALLEFSFSVQEYLKGSGADEIVTVWAAAPFFDTQEEAEDALPTIVAAWDAQWDDHEAIVFLQQDFQEFLPSTQQANRYYLAWGGGWPMDAPDDGYSLASRHDKLSLPASAAVGAPSQPTGEQQRFLMDVPPAEGSGPTITLGEIKTRIGAVTAKLSAGDGSEEYTECVRLTYRYERDDRYSIQTGGDGYFYRTPDQKLDSGLAASSVVYELLALGALPDRRDELWLDGGDADLFRVELSEGVPHDYSGDGTNDSIQYTQRVVSERPLPGGVYSTQYNNRHVDFVLCDGNTIRYEWTVMVNAPAGTLHEAFFDPVTDGTAVAADDSNGVLSPATFTDANGASATLERIAWEPGTGESGTVKLKLNPHTGVADHMVNFIALDGTVALSLEVADATVDAANRTLSWAVASQPWQSGDLLMLRIRKGCSGGTAVTNPGANPGLVSDCEALLAAKDTLRGTATLNWSFDTVITSWDGVTVGGAPKRITELGLSSRSLTGSIPSSIGSLVELTHLNLSSNTLTGEIPEEIGQLSDLVELRLSGNTLTGCIPLPLKDVATNDLSSLNLLYCQPPTPQNLSAGTPSETSIPLPCPRGCVDQYPAARLIIGVTLSYV